MIAAWFAYDVDDGFSFHDTEAEARACAESAMDRYRDNAAGQEWDEETEDICWGRVRQRAFVTSREPAPEGTDYDETVDYGLVEVSEDLALPCPHAAERDAAHREIEEAERVLCAEPIDGRDDLATCARQVVALLAGLREAIRAHDAACFAHPCDAIEHAVALFTLRQAARLPPCPPSDT